MILDSSADVEDQIKKICKTCHFHLTNISKIRTYLDRESTEAIIHAFVTTNLDYCNVILYGLPKVLLNRLQLVQNRAARIVTFTKRYEHITSSLLDLHWLPVEYRITVNSENKPRGLYFSKAFFEGLIFRGAYIRRGLSMEEICISKSIGLAL